MKTGIWQGTKQTITDFLAKTRYIWKISFKKKQVAFLFYQFTKDFQLSESPYLIYCQQSHPTVGNLEQLVLRKLELLPAPEISLFLSYHFTRFTANPLGFLHYSKGLFEGKIQAMLAEDAHQPVPNIAKGIIVYSILPYPGWSTNSRS